MNDKITKVVSILSPYKVVINIGAENGVSLGQKVLIFGLSTDTIKDPDTGEDLGKIEIVRGKGKVTHIQAKISTIESIEKETNGKRIVKSYKGFQALLNQAAEETVFDNDLKPFDEVQIGDYVRFE